VSFYMPWDFLQLALNSSCVGNPTLSWPIFAIYHSYLAIMPMLLIVLRQSLISSNLYISITISIAVFSPVLRMHALLSALPKLIPQLLTMLGTECLSKLYLSYLEFESKFKFKLLLLSLAFSIF
jgi:hypothetical protein